ncbi:MAG: hypothetical protein RJA36_950 [Pseudomonadota bacterium]|jgi:type IV pilus assembly protein PilX
MKPRPASLRRAGRHAQHGFALLTGLIMLLMVSLLGLAAARGIRHETQMANNTRERDLAFQAAEAALADAESKLQTVYHDNVKANDFSRAGLIDRSTASTEDKIKPTTARYWTDAAPNGYGWFDASGAVDTGKSIVSSQTVAGVDQQARYVVEYLGTIPPPVLNPPCSLPTYRYRLTALAVGAATGARKIADTRVMLQSEVMFCPI